MTSLVFRKDMVPQILFVDDEPNILDGIKRAFRKEPYKIITAKSATEALSILQSVKPAVVVTDQKMPSMSGTEFLSIVRRNFPDTVRIMLTGQGDLETAMQAVNDGEIYRFFTKPYNEIELGIAIRQAIQQRELFCKARQMLDKLRVQSSVIEHLERETPGITKVERNEEGTVIVTTGIENIDALLEQIEEEIVKTEKSKI